ncbi:YDG domain-containing protein [Asticcacaulis solisilvae]|uniref:YDG domain-containing protein n=1 Tax=Asticcacaulis solisilvae TaxID=1217274 RepID=UPI003FD815F3
MHGSMLCAVIAMAPALAHAQAQSVTLPTNGRVVAGNANVSGNGAGLVITQASDKAVIDWTSFSIGQGGTVQFDNGTGATLNRVTGGNLSSIDGLLSATGSVYLINPNGVIVGKSGVVKVGGSFVASALDLDNAGFLKGGDHTFEGQSLASVVNLGKIGALGGDVALIATNVRNDGTITAPNGTIGLLAGSRILMRDASLDDGRFLVLSGGKDTSVTNTGAIEAAAAELRAEGGSVYALAGNTDGVLRATGVTSADGHIYLTAGAGGSVQVSGSTLKAADAAGNGGAISVTGGQVTVASGSVLDASATAATGKGGSVSAIADMSAGQLVFQGTALARGGLNGGDGGFVETSGHAVNFKGAKVDTSARGKTGTWLTDPDDLVIDDSAAATINDNLATTDVVLQTTAPVAGGNGDIIVNSDIAWSTGQALTFDAYHSIQFNANVTVSGAGSVTLTTAHGDYAFALGKSLSFTGAGGSLTINGNSYSLLTSLDDLAGLEGNSTGNYAFSTDLAASSAYSASVLQDFDGTLTGLGHTISNLTITQTNGGATGLVGNNNGTIRDIGILGGAIEANDLVGAVAGYSGGTIRNVYSSAAVTGDGGISYVGGLVGYNDGLVSNSFATGAVNAPIAQYVGGLAGYNNGTIDGAYATGSVTGDVDVGGLVGWNEGGVFNAYATGRVTGNGDVGGFVGTDDSTAVGSSDADTTGQANAIGVSQGNGNADSLTTAQMQSGTLPNGLGTGYWSSAAGYYPWLTTFGMPKQIISGYAYGVGGGAAAGATLNVYNGGSQLGGTGTSGANGYYYIMVDPNTVGAATRLGVTEILNGDSAITGASYTDAPNLSVGNLTGLDVTGFNVTSGKLTYTTADTTYSALQSDVSNTFGATAYTDIQSGTGTANTAIIASGAFRFDQAATFGGGLTVTAVNGISLGGSIGTAGATTFGSAVTLAADTSVSTGNSALTFSSTIDGGYGLTVNSGSNTTTFGAAIGATSALTSLGTGSLGTTVVQYNITTTGAQTYANSVHWNRSSTLASTGGGDITFHAVTGTSTVATVNTSGTTTFGTSSLRSLTTDSAGTTRLTGNVTTYAAQTYNDAVTLGSTVTVSSTGGYSITFNKTVDGAYGLTVNNQYPTLFNGVVGGTTALTSLTTDTGGTVSVKGNVSTTGNQTFGEALTLTGAATFKSTGGGAIKFSSTVNGAYAMTVNTSGATTFSNTVGSSTALTSLTTDAAGSTTLKNTVKTTGAQTYNDAVTLTGTTTLTSNSSGNITLANTVNGAYALAVNTAGTTSFGGAIGGTTALASVTTDSAGTTWLGANITTSGGQTYNDIATLKADAILASTGNGGITFGKTVDGAYSLTVNTTGATTFGGAIGGTTALTALTTNSGGTTGLAGNITTSGNQSLGDAVTLNADAVLTATSGTLSLNGTVDGAHALALKGTGVTLNGIIGGTTALTSLNARASSGNINLGAAVHTTGATLLAANGIFSNTAGSSALDAGGGFTVYTQNAADPTGTLPVNSFGGLTATNYYNNAYDFSLGTFASAVPTGNHFVYAYAASVTPTLSGSASKTYDALTTAGMSGLTLSAASLVSGSDSVTFAMTGAAFDSKNVGSSKTVTASGISLSGNPNNYTLASTTASAAVGEITRATLTLAAVTDSKTYDGGTTSTGTVSVTGLKGSDTVDATQSFGSKNVLGTNASTLSVDSNYTVHDGNSGGNYSVDATGTAAGTIGKATLTLAAVTDSKTYDGGTSSTGTVSVTGLKGSDTVDATQSFGSKNVLGTNASTLSVDSNYTVHDGNSGGNYAITSSQTALGTISKATLTLAAVTDSKTYDGGTSSTGSVSVTGLKGSDTVDATQSFGSKNVLGTNASTLSVDSNYTVHDGNSGGNYTVDATGTAAGTIGKATLTLAAVTDSKTYDGGTTSTGTVSVTGLKGSDTIDATQSFGSKNVLGTNASTLSVDSNYTVHDGNSGGNYTVDATGTAAGTIGKATLTLAAVTDSKTYDGGTSSTGTVSVTGLKGSDTIDATQSFGSKNVLGTNASTLSVDSNYTVHDGNGGGNYNITSSQTALGTINKATLTLAAVTDSKTYDGGTTSTGSVSVTGLKGSDTVDATQSFGSKNVLGTNASTLSVDNGYTVHDGNSGGNYNITSSQTALGTISKATLTLAAVTDSKTYDGGTSSTGTVNVTGLKGSDTVDATQSFGSKNVLGTNASTLSVDSNYTVHDGNSGGNYTVDATGTAAGTIGKATLTLAAVTDSKTYDGGTNSTGSVSVTGLKGSDTVDATQSFGSKNVLGTNASTLSVDSGYVVHDGNSGDNYTVDATGTAAGTIGKATLTLAAVTDSKTYDGGTSSTGTVGVTGLKGSDTVDATQSFGSKNVLGTNASTLSVDSNYTVHDGNSGGNYNITSSQTALGTISKATLTLAAVTDSKTYDGGTSSTGTVGVTGLKGSDTVDATQSFGSKNVLGTNASTLSVDSGYTVHDGNSGGNYNITSSQTALGTISKATLTLAAVTDSKTYDGGTSSTGTVSVTGLKGSDTVEATQSFGSKNVLGTNVSTLSVDSNYTVHDGNSGGNYTVDATGTAAGTIGKASLTLAAVTDSKTYDGGTSSTGTVSVTGLKGSDAVDATQSFGSKNVLGTNASTLSVDNGYVVHDGNSGGNYNITSSQTALGTISKATLTLAAVTDSKTYDGGTSSTGTVGVTGLKGSDTVDATQSFGSKNVLGTNASTLSVDSDYTVHDGNSGGNYAITSSQTALGTISKAMLTLAAVTDSKTYDATTTSTGAVSISGLKGSDTVSGATQVFDNQNAGARTLLVNGYSVSDGNGGSNYTVTTQTASGTIAKAALTLTASSDSKAYDATTTSTGVVSISGLKGSDSVTGASQMFDSQNAGARTLLVNGYTVNDGNGGGNYTVATQTASGAIAKAALTLTASSDSKTYDASTTSTGAISVSGLKGSDTVTGTSQVFDSKNAGARTLLVNGYTVNDGNGGGNYTVATQTASGSIAKAALTLTASSDSKTYDATTTSSGTVGVSGLKDSDTVTGTSQVFDSKNAGARTVLVNGYTVNDGNNGGNYTVATQTAFGSIAKAALAAGLTGTTSKTYDATTAASLTSANYTLSGVLSGDDVALNMPAAATYADANAGAGKSVQVAGLTVSGTDAGNYTVNGSATGTIGTIAVRSLTLAADNTGKFSGAADPLLTYTFATGSLAGNDALSGSLQRTSGEDPGVYAIGQGTLQAGSNYAVTVVPGVFTITAVAKQNQVVVVPSTPPSSQPSVQPAQIVMSGGSPSPSTPSSSATQSSTSSSGTSSSGTSSPGDSGAKGAGDGTSGGGEAAASSANLQVAGDSGAAFSSGGGGNQPYPDNQAVSSSITFSTQ